MINQALIFLLETVLGLFSLALLLRFYLQLLRAPYRNPLSQFLAALTDFLVRPARRFIPGLWGIDLATLVLAWLLELLILYIGLMLRGVEPKAATGVFILALCFMAAMRIVKLTLYILMVAIIMQAILSWVAPPYSPMTPLLNALTQPFLRPLRKRIPPVGNVDLSPLLLILIIQLILILPVQWLELNMVRLL
jgi:YggT family protein